MSSSIAYIISYISSAWPNNYAALLSQLLALDLVDASLHLLFIAGIEN